MTTAQRFFSLAILGSTALLLAPLASAMGPLGDLSEEDRTAIRTELEACRENNEEHEDKKVCAEAVFESHGIEKPEGHWRRGRGKKFGHKFRSQIVETCGERDDSDAWRECAKEARETLRDQFKEEHPNAFNRFRNRRSRHADLREQLRACLDRTDHDSLRACVIEVRDAIRGEEDNI